MPVRVMTASPRSACAAKRKRNAFQRLAFEAIAKDIGPGDGKPAIGRPQRRYRHALRGERFHPSAIRPEPRPARAAERQHGRIGIDGARAVGRQKRQMSSVVPAGPAMTQRELHADRIQPPQPRAQQRRGLEGFRENPAAGADKGRLPQRFAPVAQAHPAETPRSRASDAASRCRSAREIAGNASLCVRLSPPRPASRNLRPTEASRHRP